MAAATATVIRPDGEVSVAAEVRNSSEIYPGELSVVVSSQNGTAANVGRAHRFTKAANDIPIGWPSQRRTGNTSAIPVPKWEGDHRARVRKLPVTGLAGDRTDRWKPVYATDGSAFTLTMTSAPTLIIGYVIEQIDSTNAWVLCFGLMEFTLFAMSGGGFTIMNLGSVDCDTITAANIRTAFPMPFHGRFIDFFAMVDVAITGGGGTALLNLEIGGVDVTGGVVTVSTAAGGTKGTKLAGTGITALNEFHEGDVLDIEAATVTDMTAGRVDLFAKVEFLPGI